MRGEIPHSELKKRVMLTPQDVVDGLQPWLIEKADQIRQSKHDQVVCDGIRAYVAETLGLFQGAITGLAQALFDQCLEERSGMFLASDEQHMPPVEAMPAWMERDRREFWIGADDFPAEYI